MICRIAKEACLPPKPTKKDEYGELIIDEVSLEERQAQPMHVKIYNIISILMKNCCDSKFKQGFKRPKKDKKKNLYILPGGKFF